MDTRVPRAVFVLMLLLLPIGRVRAPVGALLHALGDVSGAASQGVARLPARRETLLLLLAGHRIG